EEDRAASADPQEDVVAQVATNVRWPARDAQGARARHARRIAADGQLSEPLHGNAGAEAGLGHRPRLGMRIVAAGGLVPAFKTIAGIARVVGVHAVRLEADGC